MPSEGIKPITHKDILTYEEITRIVKIMATLGIKKVRLTGGEPLSRRGITSLISYLRGIKGIESISMTTNGILLERYAEKLVEAGLNRVNVSLDSLNPERYREITRGGSLEDVMKGIEKADKVGLRPVRINMVPIRGINDDEIEGFARLTLVKPYQVRFIEFMPIGSQELWSEDKYITMDEIKARVERIGRLTPVRLRRAGPARYFRFDSATGVIGFINAVTHKFCSECNRIRLTADGYLRPCLFYEKQVDLKGPIRDGATDEEIERLITLSIKIKPMEHHIGCRDGSSFFKLRPMSKIGG